MRRMFGQGQGFVFLWALLLAIPIVLPFGAQARVQLAFLELVGPEGRVIPLERDGRFGHVAIGYRGLWLHSYPRRLVELVTTDELEQFGRLAEILIIEDLPEPTVEQVTRLLGLPFDNEMEWDNPFSTYCSKLVGTLLNLEPLPTNYDAEIWKQYYYTVAGGLGLSPDDVYRLAVEKLQARPASNSASCEKVLH